MLFQTDNANTNQTNYPAYHCQVKNIHIKNGRIKVFPMPQWNLKIKKKRVC